MGEAVKEAEEGLTEGGIPIGSLLVLNGEIIGKGRNQREQKASVILHAEMDAIENAGVLNKDNYQNSVLYTTLSPCQMCAGTIVYLGIPTVVIAENGNIVGAEDFLTNNGIELIHIKNEQAEQLLKEYQLE